MEAKVTCFQTKKYVPMLHVLPWKGANFTATPCLANPSLPIDHHQIGSTLAMVALEPLLSKKISK